MIGDFLSFKKDTEALEKCHKSNVDSILLYRHYISMHVYTCMFHTTTDKRDVLLPWLFVSIVAVLIFDGFK